MALTTPSWETAKKVLTQADMERLACAFLTQDGVEKLNVDAAAAQFGGNIKPASFKRSIWVILKKVREAEGKDVGEGSGDVDEGEGGKKAGAKGKGKGGRKRKADEDPGEETDGEAMPTTKKGKAKGGKKAKAAMAESNGDGDDAADGDTAVKAEDEDDGFN